MIRLKRLGAVIASTALAAGLTTLASPASAAPASAVPAASVSAVSYGSCSLVAPKKLAITTPYKAVTLRLASNCLDSGVDYASWDLYHPTEGWDGITIFDGKTSDIWDVYDWDLLPGSRYTWRPSSAWDMDSNDIAQNSAYTDVKLGSSASITTSRSGNYVTIATTSWRYSTSADKYVRWTKPRGVIQYYGPKGWTFLRYAYQSTSGTSSYKVYAPKARSYRVVFPDVKTIWGFTTKTSRR